MTPTTTPSAGNSPLSDVAAAAKAAKAAPADSGKRPSKADSKPRTVAKTSPKPAAAKPPAPTAKPREPEETRDSKFKKPKLVRDSFTIPKDEYAVVETLKQRSAALAHPVKKSELLRAGLKVLAAMSDAALRSAVQAVPSIKTGRPKAVAVSAAPAAPAKSRTKASRK
ncbi:hypothetical protein [Acidovorax sp. FHTAMBA]|jgi:hypothetical protein|uniref:hypothetical protein n=1 Tax=Acidovorax sp. FHTAMBA TaxID=3140252 RepID=UPI003183C5BB